LELSEDPNQMMATLVANKLRFIAILSVMYLTSYVGLTALAGFARPFMAATAPSASASRSLGSNGAPAWRRRGIPTSGRPSFSA
jgi:uncharacterized membrane protein (DUF485 family)